MPHHWTFQRSLATDSIFKALGVESLEDVTKLSYFFTFKNENESDSEEALIHPNEVIRAIRRFFESQKSGKTTLDTSNDHDDEDEERVSIAKKDLVKKVGKSKEELQKEYWKQMSEIIDINSYRVWNVISQIFNARLFMQQWTNITRF